ARAAATGATAGARVLPGYLVCALVGLAAFRYSANGAVVHVRYLPGVLHAGVVYPVAFGALGGALRGATR
ncbi:MAG: transporter, partial [Halobacterium sp.]